MKPVVLVRTCVDNQWTRSSCNFSRIRLVLLFTALVCLALTAVSKYVAHASGAGERPDVIWMRGGHVLDIHAMDYSPDGQLFVSEGDGTGVIKVWRVSDGMLLRTIRVSQSGIGAVKFLADSQSIVVTGAESNANYIKRVHISDGQIIWNISGGGSGVRLQITPEGDIFTSGSGFQFYRASDGFLLNNCHATFYLDSNGIRRDFGGFSDGYLANNGTIAVSIPVGSLGDAYPALVDPNYCYTDANNVTWCHLVAYFPAQSGGVRAITPDGSQILTYGGSDQSKIYRVSDACFTPGTCSSTLPLAVATITGDHNGNPTFSPDGQTLAIHTLGAGSAFNVYNVTGWSLRFSQPHTGYMTTAFSPDSQTVANNNYPAGQTSSWFARVNFTRVSDGISAGVLNSHTGMVKSVAFSSDSQLFASADNGGDSRFDDRVVHIFRASDGTLLNSFVGDQQSVNSIAFSPIGSYLATGGNTSVKLWNTSDGSLIRTFGSNIFAYSVAFSPDGTKLLTGGASTPRVNLWDVQTGNLIRSFFLNTGYTSAVAISPDGQTMAATDGFSSTSAVISFWKVSDGTFLRSVSTSGDVSSIAFSPDSQNLIAGLRENNAGSRASSVREWQVSSGTFVRDYTGHSNWVESVAFSPDGGAIMSASTDGIRVWDAASGTQLKLFDQEIGIFDTSAIGNPNILSVAFSPDGSKIGYGRFDATAVVAQNPLTPQPSPTPTATPTSTPTPTPTPSPSPTPTPIDAASIKRWSVNNGFYALNIFGDGTLLAAGNNFASGAGTGVKMNPYTGATIGSFPVPDVRTSIRLSTGDQDYVVGGYGDRVELRQDGSFGNSIFGLGCCNIPRYPLALDNSNDQAYVLANGALGVANMSTGFLRYIFGAGDTFGMISVADPTTLYTAGQSGNVTRLNPVGGFQWVANIDNIRLQPGGVASDGSFVVTSGPAHLDNSPNQVGSRELNQMVQSRGINLSTL